MSFAEPDVSLEYNIIRDIAKAFATNIGYPLTVRLTFGYEANFEAYREQLENGETVYLMQGPIIDFDEQCMKDSRGAYISGRYFAWVAGSDPAKLVQDNAKWHKMLMQTEAPFAGLGRRAKYPVDFPDSTAGNVRFMKYELPGNLRALARPNEAGDYFAIEQLVEFTARKIP